MERLNTGGIEAVVCGYDFCLIKDTEPCTEYDQCGLVELGTMT